MVAVVWVVFLPVLVVAQEVTGVLCPGGELRCPDHMTCCPLANKHYGCCPFPEAVCCHDHVHCCPSNMACDVVHQACLKNGFPVVFFWQVRVHPELVEVVEKPAAQDPPSHLITNHLEDLATNSIVEETHCPDGRKCPGSYTCCKMYRGDYGCCPYRDAQCCSDGFHCCPPGSKCDVTGGGCQNTITNVTMNAARLTVGKSPTQRHMQYPTRSRGGEVRDPGGKCLDGHPCPEKFTCCKVKNGGYGCCPYSNARCCTDFIHCCPQGTNCNTTTGTCDVQRSTWSVPAYSLLTHKLTAEVRSMKADLVNQSTPNGMCPDHQSECPDGNTCCRMKGSKYGCCPMPRATCCSDMLHCCPHGYKCQNAGCYREEEGHLIEHSFVTAPVTEVQEEIQEIETLQVEDVVCPDHHSSCPDGNTCCELGVNTWGCCPMPRATCCSDKEHCCPHGYRCADEGCERLSGVWDEIVHKTPLSNSTTTNTLLRSSHVEFLLP
ncbi:hypothetical protein Pmani_038093 [Petrolisthes manimaculis]|uniref:Granulins domain-containing protein n=1 Tax=Petrolisthes manimaculis TaxID=1843537 RepID=A0AAE1NF79_9EUCA|nr:hypothetical protein Pmani_038093 [Petrolisthes manimaculis]